MKKLLLITLLSAFVLPAVGQEDSLSVEKKYSFKNQFEFDVEFLSTGVSYKNRISSSILLIGSIGGGAKINLINYNVYSNNIVAELFYTSVHLTYPFKRMHIMYGVKYALLMHDDVEFANFYAVEFGVYIDLKHILLGVKPFLGISQEKKGIDKNNLNFLYGSSLLSIKIPIKKW